jgi:hypothetical protein
MVSWNWQLRRLALMFALASAWPVSALACRCTEPSRMQSYRQASGIVLGTVEAVRSLSEFNTFFDFIVDEAWKMKMGDRLTIRSGGTCIYRVEVGQKYLLFLSPYTPGTYQTNVCMGSKTAGEAGAMLQFLRRARR